LSLCNADPNRTVVSQPADRSIAQPFQQRQGHGRFDDARFGWFTLLFCGYTRDEVFSRTGRRCLGFLGRCQHRDNQHGVGLARSDEKTAYLAFYFAITTGMLALGTIVGGMLADHFRKAVITLPLTDMTWNYAQLSFVLSWLMRFISGLWLIPFFRVSRCR